MRTTHINIILILTLTFSCNLVEKENNIEVEYYPNGEKKLVIISEPEKNKQCGQSFFQNGKLRKEYCYVKGIREGYFKDYYENGQLKTDAFYKDGKTERELKFFYPNGQLDEISFYKNGMVEGELFMYNEDGSIRAENFVVHDFIHYVKVFHYNEQLINDSISENYNVRFEISNDTINVEDTIAVNFYLPLPNDKFDLEEFKVKFEFMKDIEPKSDSLFYPTNELSMAEGKAKKRFIIFDSGKHLMYGFLSKEIDGTEIEYQVFEVPFYVRPINIPPQKKQ